MVLQPVPRVWVEHLAGADDPFESGVIDVGERVFAVAHQHAYRRGRREHAGDAELFDRDAPVERRASGDRAPLRMRPSCSRQSTAHKSCSCDRRSTRCRMSPTTRPTTSARSTSGPCWRCEPDSRHGCAPQVLALRSFLTWRGYRPARSTPSRRAQRGVLRPCVRKESQSISR